MARQSSIPKDTPPDVIERDIMATRLKMSRTLDQIQERFSAAHIKGVVKETFKARMNSAGSRANELAGRAKDSALRLARAARDRSQRAKQGLLRFIKEDPSAARIIAFEAGALLVILAQDMMKSKSKNR